MAGKIYTTDEIKKIVEPIAYEYGVKSLSLFGSYARGEARPDSDIDFRLIDKGSIADYFALSGFRLKLEDTLGVNVDVLTTGSLDDDFITRISKEEVILYEQS